MKFALAIVISMFLLGCSTNLPKPEADTKSVEYKVVVSATKDVAGTNGLRCHAYLHAPEGSDPTHLPLLVNVVGTGLYTTGNGLFSSYADTAIKQGKIAILTFDRPGISIDPTSTDPDSESRFEINLDQFVRYTQRDLIQCAANAIVWATQSFQFKGPVILGGHSEGVEVLTRTYIQLLKEHPELRFKIRALMLSGVPMQDWKSTIVEQYNAFYPKGLREVVLKREFDAIRRKDDVFLILRGSVSSTYLKAAFKDEKLEDSFRHLAELNPPAEIYVFQGEQDLNTRAQLVKDFQEKNSTLQKQGKPHLKLNVRYYQAAHGLNAEARSDQIKRLSELIQ